MIGEFSFGEAAISDVVADITKATKTVFVQALYDNPTTQASYANPLIQAIAEDDPP